jgi:hypothetical protein
MATEKKLHWTQTPEGKARMATSIKKMWAAKRAAKKAAKKYTKRVVPMKIIVTGKDAHHALAILLNGAKLDVIVTVERM